jgi:hypothetical protein
VRVNGSVVGFKKDKDGQTVMTKLDEANAEPHCRSR